MAQPAFFPSSDNRAHVIKEVQSHINTLSEHLQKMLQDHQLLIQMAFLKEFSDNVNSLNTLIRSLDLDDMSHERRKILEESISILSHVLNLSIEPTLKTAPMTLLSAVKNYTTPSPQKSDLSQFLSSLERYPESLQIIIQELDLVSKDLKTVR